MGKSIHYLFIGLLILMIAISGCDKSESPVNGKASKSPISKVGCGDGVCDSKESSNPSLCPKDCAPKCADSDQGKNYNVKGSTTGSKLSWDDSPYFRTSFEDSCIDFSIGATGQAVSECSKSETCKIDEYFCQDDTIYYEYVTCDNGCKDGACVNPIQTTPEKPVYILWLNHYKDHVNVNDNIKILNDLIGLFEANGIPVEWTFNGVLLQALRDGVKWPSGYGHSTDEWLIMPNPDLIKKLQNARKTGTVFSSFSDTFMPYWGIEKIRKGELKSFDTALALELERNTYFRDPVSNLMDKKRTGGQFKIFEEIFGTGNAYVFHPSLEPHYEYAARIQGSQKFGADVYNLGKIAAEYEGPWYWYMGDMHYTFYAPDMVDGIMHWDPQLGTKQIDEDISAMKEYITSSKAKYGAMYAGVHTFTLYMQGCMNSGEYDYDNPPAEPCTTSPYMPNRCALTSYSIGSFGGNLIAPKYDKSCFNYLNSKDHVPKDWYEMMHNPSTQPTPDVVREGRREETYQRNFNYLTRFVEKLKQKVNSDPELIIVTRETAEKLVQSEEGRAINKDTIYQIALFLINNWQYERPPNFVMLKESSSAADKGSDYFTVSESYRLLHKSLTNYIGNELPLILPNQFALAPTKLSQKDDIKTEITGKFTIREIIQAANSINAINKYGDYQVSDYVLVGGKRINPAEFLLLVAKAYKSLYEKMPVETQIDFTGSKILTPIGSDKGVMGCDSSWCPYQSWTFKPAKYIG